MFVVQGDDGRAVNRTLAGSGLLGFFPVRGSLAEATEAAGPGRISLARPPEAEGYARRLRPRIEKPPSMPTSSSTIATTTATFRVNTKKPPK